MDWIETTSGNRISKKSKIFGSNSILINGNCTINDEVLLQGDVRIAGKQQATIQIGKCCYLGTGAKITPPVLKYEDEESIHGPLLIGGYTIIGKNSVVRLANIGSRVLVELGCDLGNLSIVYDCCLIRSGTIIPPKMVIPPFSDVSGVPGIDFCIKDLSNSYKKLIEIEARELQALG
jgi:dynactin-5